jgi:hypothetical protein
VNTEPVAARSAVAVSDGKQRATFPSRDRSLATDQRSRGIVPGGLASTLPAASPRRDSGRADRQPSIDAVHRHLRLPFTRMGTDIDNIRARRQIEAVGGYEAVQ